MLFSPNIFTLIALITSYKLAKVFGHGIGYTLGLFFSKVVLADSGIWIQ